MNILKCLTALILLIFTLIPFAIAGEEVVRDGVIHVTNSDVSTKGTEVLQLKEIWRIGGEDEAIIFRDISDVLLGRDNNTYTLDQGSKLIYVNSSLDGDLIRTINISGEGPGELSFAHDIFLIGDDEIAMLRGFPAKIVCIDYNGLPGRYVDLNSGEIFMAGPGDWEAGVLILGSQTPTVTNGRTSINRYSDFGEMHTYESYPMRSSPTKRKLVEEDFYFIKNKPWDIDKAGQLYTVPYWNGHDKQEYLVNVYDINGVLRRVFTRKFEAHKRSDKDKLAVHYKFWGGEKGMQELKAIGGEYEVEDFDQDVLEIYSRPDGNIWIRTSQSASDQLSGIMITYDVFDSQGHFIKQVSLACDANGEKDIVYFLDNDRIAIVKGQTDVLNGGAFLEADILEVICYSVE